jgi:hypothetical protein
MVGYAIWKDRNAWIVGNTRLHHLTLNLLTLILEQCRLLRSALGVGTADAERESRCCVRGVLVPCVRTWDMLVNIFFLL